LAKITSTKLMSRTCFNSGSSSIALQKIIGAARLKFYQKGESSHS